MAPKQHNTSAWVEALLADTEGMPAEQRVRWMFAAFRDTPAYVDYRVAIIHPAMQRHCQVYAKHYAALYTHGGKDAV